MRSLLFASLFVAGCTVGAPAGQDLTSQAPDHVDPTPNPPTCTASSPTCKSSERSYGTVSTCTNAGESLCRRVTDGCGNAFYCGSGGAQCDAVPNCDSGDSQVSTCESGATCYQRTACGTTITCQEPRVVECNAYPSCNSGDDQVTDTTTCKDPSANCYSRTLCGWTIWCIKR